MFYYQYNGNLKKIWPFATVQGIICSSMALMTLFCRNFECHDIYTHMQKMPQQTLLQ